MTVRLSYSVRNQSMLESPLSLVSSDELHTSEKGGARARSRALDMFQFMFSSLRQCTGKQRFREPSTFQVDTYVKYKTE